MLRARSRSPQPSSPSSPPPPALETVLVTRKICDICNLRLFKEKKRHAGERGGADTATNPQLSCKPAVRDAPPPTLPGLVGMRSLHLAPSFTGKHVALVPVPPPGSPSSEQSWCQTRCLCPCARERTVSPPGSWDLQRRARVGGKERQLGPNACCQALQGAPKSSCKGREVLVDQTSPRAALWAPQQRLGGGCTPSPGCAAQVGV